MNDTLSNHITGFQRLEIGQPYLGKNVVKMLENWQSALNKSDFACVLYLDLSKAFYAINLDLLLAKLKTYAF